MFRFRPVIVGFAVSVALLAATACSAGKAVAKHQLPSDPIVLSAMRFTHGTDGQIVGYVVDWLPGKAGNELIVMKNGSLRYPGGKPDYFWLGPSRSLACSRSLDRSDSLARRLSLSPMSKSSLETRFSVHR